MTWLLDTSAFRLHEPQVNAVLEPRMSMFRVATCGPTVLELLYSTREAGELPAVRRFWTEVNPYIGLDERHVTRALDVTMALAAHRPSLHRVVKYVDLLVAAVAERSGLTVLHYDDDFDEIAKVTGQPMEWVVPRGSLSG